MAYNRPPQVTLAGIALKQNPPPSVVQPAGIVPVTLDAEIASKNNLGVVQIGEGIDVTDDGIISVSGTVSGPTGPTGPTGATGVPGPSGINGYTGSQGPTGETGPSGVIGYTGSQGPTGATGPSGVIGYTGSRGATGYTGSQGSTGPSGVCRECKTRTVSSSYQIQKEDYYIGVNSNNSTTMTLPNISDSDCFKFIIKAEMSSPLGNRKITIKPQGSSKLDGSSDHQITVAYECVTVISNGGDWWII
jgi:hypothetical protein